MPRQHKKEKSRILKPVRTHHFATPKWRHYGENAWRQGRTVTIAYNSMLLSGLLTRYLASGNDRALDLLRRISPAARQHLHFLGHYAFRDKRNPIDLDAILEGIDWE